MKPVHMHPLSKLDATWARDRSTAAANPSLNPSRFDSLHSIVRSFIRVTFMETKAQN